MRFRVRNLFYLRLSSSDVIPLYLYLDERHVDWMSGGVLRAVVTDLRPLIGPKLEAERNAHYGSGGPANAKKGTVQVHRGDSYQFAYFLRKAEPHSVVFKTRNFVVVNRAEHSSNTQVEGTNAGRAESAPANGNKTRKGTKRPRKTTAAPKKQVNKKGKGKAKVVHVVDDSEEEAEESPLSDSDEDDDVGPVVPGRSSRRKKQRTAYLAISDDDGDGEGDIRPTGNVNTDKEVQIKQETTDDVPLRDAVIDDNAEDEEPNPEPPLPPNFGVDEDEEEKKSKPVVQLSFRSLNMHNRCLCVVVEPWPAPPEQTNAPRASLPAPSVRNPSYDRAPSAAPSRFSVGPGGESGREQTPLPLFLPDPSGRDRSETPAPVRLPSEFASLHTMDDTQDPTIENDDNFGMVAFSQALNNVSGDRIGAAEEEDEMDGGALYGDADEIRGAI